MYSPCTKKEERLHQANARRHNINPQRHYSISLALFTSEANPKWRCMNDSHCWVMLILSRYDFGTTSSGNSFKVSHILALLTTAFLARTNCSIHKISSATEIKNTYKLSCYSLVHFSTSLQWHNHFQRQSSPHDFQEKAVHQTSSFHGQVRQQLPHFHEGGTQDSNPACTILQTCKPGKIGDKLSSYPQKEI